MTFVMQLQHTESLGVAVWNVFTGIG